MSGKQKSIISIILIFIMVGSLGLQNVNAGSQLTVYSVGGNLENYIQGTGTYFNGSHTYYSDSNGDVCYCVQAGKKGAAQSGTGGYVLGNATVSGSKIIVDALETIMYRGYPQNYGKYICGGSSGSEIYKSGMIINGGFYECTQEEARAATAFAIHRQMIAVQQSYPNSTSGNERTIISYKNGSKATHDVVKIVEKLNDYAGQLTPSANISFAEVNDAGTFKTCASEKYYDKVINGKKYKATYVMVKGSNCSLSNIWLEVKSEDVSDAFINNIIYQDVFSRIVEICIPYNQMGKGFTVKASGVSKERKSVKLYGNSIYQDVIASCESGGTITTSKYIKAPLGSLKVYKKDSVTNKPVSGVRFTLYSDLACKTVYDSFVTNNDGVGVLNNIPSGDYYLKETEVPAGYKLNSDTNTIKIYGNKETEQTIYNEPNNLTLYIYKKDVYSNSYIPSGDASLAGAEFGIYADEDIYVNSELKYKKDELVRKVVTEKIGDEYIAKADNIYIGKYYAKELSAGKGYIINEEKFIFEDASDKNGLAQKTVVSEKPQKQAFQIEKISSDNLGNTVYLKEAGFSAWRKSDLKVKDNGEYDFDGAEPVVITKDGETELFTDENGYAVSCELFYGTYVLRETTVPPGYLPIEPFEIVISKDSREPMQLMTFYDDRFSVKLEIYKVDKKTGEIICEEGYGFRIYDRDNDCYVGETYYSDSDGFVDITEKLYTGNYSVIEVEIPQNSLYAINDAGYDFSISADCLYEKNDAGLPVYRVFYENEAVTGKIVIEKICENEKLSDVLFELYDEKDEFICEMQTDENGIAEKSGLSLGNYYVIETKTKDGCILDSKRHDIKLEYENQNIPVVSEKIKVENKKTEIKIVKISSFDGSILNGAKLAVYDTENNLIEKWTQEKECHVIKGLVVGKQYILREEKAPLGYKLAEDIEFTVENTLEIKEIIMEDDVDTGNLKIKKYGDKLDYITIDPATANDAEVDFVYSKEPLENVRFYLYAANDNVRYKKDEKVAELVTDMNGEAFLSDLPCGDYYLIEKETNPGYVLLNDKITFTIKGQEENKEGYELVEINNTLDKTKISVIKKDYNSKKPMKGVAFGIYSVEDIYNCRGDMFLAKDTLIDKIVTDEDGIAKSTKQYPYGRYYIIELETNEGYMLDNEKRYIDFKPEGDKEICFEIYNEKIMPVETNVKTGDNYKFGIIFILAFSALGMFFTIYIKKRK